VKINYLYSKILKKLRGAAVHKSQIHATSSIHSGTLLLRSSIERHSYCGYDCSMIFTNVGPFTSIGSRVTIGGATHPMHFVSTSPVFLSHRDSVRTKLARHDYLPSIATSIGADVWIGDGAYIKAVVSIGHGAVIGMAAVVTRDVPPYAIVGGNPARLIKYRFPDALCAGLLESRWWDLSDTELAELGHLIVEPEAFVAAIKEKAVN
jgi:acetyltransferase-like isoleucine patch superfamily enzyme